MLGVVHFSSSNMACCTCENWGRVLKRHSSDHIRSCFMWPTLELGVQHLQVETGLPWWTDASWWGRGRLGLTRDLSKALPKLLRLRLTEIIWNKVLLQKLSSTKVLGPSCGVIQQKSTHRRLFPTWGGMLKATIASAQCIIRQSWNHLGQNMMKDQMEPKCFRRSRWQ